MGKDNGSHGLKVVKGSLGEEGYKTGVGGEANGGEGERESATTNEA